MKLKGMNYDVGTDYNLTLSRRLDESKIFEELSFLKKYNVNSIRIYGSNEKLLKKAAEIALDLGYVVLLCPRFMHLNFNMLRRKLIEFVRDVKDLDIILSLGNELSLDSVEFFVGKTHLERCKQIGKLSLRDKKEIGEKLNNFFKSIIPEVRKIFKGPITYCAASWEKINFDLFDFVSVNLYRAIWNWSAYEKLVKNLVALGRPVLITEFGCASYRDAWKWGPVPFSHIPKKNREILCQKGDENKRAEYYLEILKILWKTKVYGAFPYTFMDVEVPEKFWVFTFSLAKREKGEIVATKALEEIGKFYSTH